MRKNLLTSTSSLMFFFLSSGYALSGSSFGCCGEFKKKASSPRIHMRPFTTSSPYNNSVSNTVNNTPRVPDVSEMNSSRGSAPQSHVNVSSPHYKHEYSSSSASSSTHASPPPHFEQKHISRTRIDSSPPPGHIDPHPDHIRNTLALHRKMLEQS
ncbi:hypothetical protein Q7M85_05180 [Candidatus Liberibacter asiaticus]